MSSYKLEKEDFPPLSAAFAEKVPEEEQTTAQEERLHKIFGADETPEIALRNFMGSIPVETESDEPPSRFEYNSLHGGRRIPLYAIGSQIELPRTPENKPFFVPARKINILKRPSSEFEGLLPRQNPV